MDYTYTIIIPHHNIPILLKRCLSSIPQRDDTQIIVVDDASNSEYTEELKNLEKEYRYVEFLYQDKSGGGGMARNIGVKYAKGEFVLFADADDFFTPCFNQVLDDYKDNDSDIVFFNALSLKEEEYMPTDRADHLNNMHRLYISNPQRAILHFKYSFGEPWCKMIRKSIIDKNKILFQETNIHNDTQFSYLVGHYSSAVKVDSRAIYCYMIRKNSVSVTDSDERYLTRVKVFAQKNKFLLENNIPFYDEHYMSSFVHFKQIGDEKKYNECIQILLEYGLSVKPIKCYLLKEKIKSYFPLIIKWFRLFKLVKANYNLV